MTSRPGFDPGFSTPEMSSIFSDEARVAHMHRFEAVLAAASAAAGLISDEAADEIGRACERPSPDPTALLAAGWEAGTPVLPLLAEIGAGLSSESAAALHHGATTQDVVDTVTMLQIAEGLDVLSVDLTAIARALSSLADRHRRTPMPARTFLRPAGSTTFGLRAALWLDPLLGHRERLRAARVALPIQLGGPTGTRAGLGRFADDVTTAMAARLGLAVPTVPWHGDRTPIASVVGMVEALVRSVAKLAADVALLSAPEIGELEVRPGGSSSIPGKRNPIDAVRALAAADACSSAARAAIEARPIELERGLGGWHLEWWAVPVVFQTAGAAVSSVRRCVETLEVDVDRMADNLGELPDDDVLEAADRLIDRVLETFTDADR